MTIKILLPSKICDVPGAKRTDIKMRKSWRSLVLVVFCSRVWLHCFLPSSQAPPRRALSHTQIGAATQLDAWSPVHTGDCSNQTSWGGAPQLSHQVTVLFAGFVGLCVCVCVSVGRPGAEQTVAPAPILCAQCSFPSKGWSKPCKVNFYLLIKSSSAQSAAGGWKLNILLMVWWKVLASSEWTDSLTEKTPPSSQGERGRKTLFIHGARWSQSLPREGDLNV